MVPVSERGRHWRRLTAGGGEAICAAISHQSVYRNSTESLLHRVTSDLVSHLDQGEMALMAFLDLSAAFNTVNKDNDDDDP